MRNDESSSSARRNSVMETISIITKKLADVRKRRAIRPDSRAMEKWDAIMITMLVFVAVMGPFEVALLRHDLDSQRGVALFVVNRIVDFIFLIDMAINFNLMYPAPKHIGGYITDKSMIVRNYVRGWFFVDLISVIPLTSSS